MLEATLAGRRTFGADSNPLARLISKTKLTWIDPASVESTHKRISGMIGRGRSATFSPVINPNLWFSDDAQRGIGAILSAIRDLEDRDMQDFFEVCLSACLRKLSFADPRLSVPVRARNPPEICEAFVYEQFDRCVQANACRLDRLRLVDPNLIQSFRLGTDARELSSLGIANQSVDLIITSPPYVGAQKYIRASSLSIGWLGLAPGNRLRALERLNIGREHFSKGEYLEMPSWHLSDHVDEVLSKIWEINPLRAHIAATYLKEMTDAFASCIAALRDDGYLVLVIGDNKICGQNFQTSQFLKYILERLGLVVELELVDAIRSRGLMTKRNRTAGLIESEHVIVMRKFGGDP